MVEDGKNLLEALIFDDPDEANHVAVRHGCALCFSPLLVTFRDGKYVIYCPNCGDAYWNSIADNTSITIAANNISCATMELEAARKPRRSEAEILAELY